MDLAENPVLTPAQKILLARLGQSTLSEQFYFTGGTALAALYLQHRLSEDIDFFTRETVPVESVLGFLRALPDVQKVEYERKFDRRLFLIRYLNGSAGKVEFTLYPFPQLEAAKVLEGIRLDSLRDILTNKLMAMTDRRDPKDYVDVYCALRQDRQLEIDRLVGDAEAKFGIRGIEPILRGRFLDVPADLGALKMREPVEPSVVKEFFAAIARRWIARSVEGERGAK